MFSMAFLTDWMVSSSVRSILSFSFVRSASRPSHLSISLSKAEDADAT